MQIKSFKSSPKELLKIVSSSKSQYTNWTSSGRDDAGFLIAETLPMCTFLSLHVRLCCFPSESPKKSVHHTTQQWLWLHLVASSCLEATEQTLKINLEVPLMHNQQQTTSPSTLSSIFQTTAWHAILEACWHHGQPGKMLLQVLAHQGLLKHTQQPETTSNP